MQISDYDCSGGMDPMPDRWRGTGMACILDFRDDHGIDRMENLPQISENELAEYRGMRYGRKREYAAGIWKIRVAERA